MKNEEKNKKPNRRGKRKKIWKERRNRLSK
jgi:hypothetical protein